ncbi:DNA-binding response OmpR family regulator [Flavobacterium sp. 28A]|uniref:response regulator transcription factor n=1 Tax=Flavobacterium sp. 28A TaxID=2735895 RepID=UPI0015707D77|nr:response regulator transcription factor [Flavobacterium sp. 28A]NRT16844.1 DNA-binding response OmpR family regulator [Flavobacterium sp. 28A]
MNILIIEDDTTISQNISLALKSENYITTVVYDGLLAERMLKKDTFDCVIMDINLPGKNGFDLCSTFRLYNSTTPVIMLTAFSELEDKVQGFDCGADDYLTKPFYMRELVLRINALIKRNKSSQQTVAQNPILIADDITLNDAEKKVMRSGQEIALTPREYQILYRLMVKNGEIVSKADLITEIWGTAFDANTNTIEVYINFLRNKLDKPFSKNTIKTKVGYGYFIDIK